MSGTEKEMWIAVKGKLISRFGTIKDAAAVLGCHPNAIRLSVQGKCPSVAKRLKKHMR